MILSLMSKKKKKKKRNLHPQMLIYANESQTPSFFTERSAAGQLTVILRD